MIAYKLVHTRVILWNTCASFFNDTAYRLLLIGQTYAASKIPKKKENWVKIHLLKAHQMHSGICVGNFLRTLSKGHSSEDPSMHFPPPLEEPQQ